MTGIKLRRNESIPSVNVWLLPTLFSAEKIVATPKCQVVKLCDDSVINNKCSFDAMYE